MLISLPHAERSSDKNQNILSGEAYGFQMKSNSPNPFFTARPPVKACLLQTLIWFIFHCLFFWYKSQLCIAGYALKCTQFTLFSSSDKASGINSWLFMIWRLTITREARIFLQRVQGPPCSEKGENVCWSGQSSRSRKMHTPIDRFTCTIVHVCLYDIVTFAVSKYFRSSC